MKQEFKRKHKHFLIYPIIIRYPDLLLYDSDAKTMHYYLEKIKF